MHLHCSKRFIIIVIVIIIRSVPPQKQGQCKGRNKGCKSAEQQQNMER